MTNLSDPIAIQPINRNAVTLYATQDLLDWIIETKPELHGTNLDSINSNPATYLIEIEDQNMEGYVIISNFRAIVAHELTNHLYIEKDKWPKITKELFFKWYEIKYHNVVYDFCKEAIVFYDD